MTLSGSTTLGQSWDGSNGNESVLRIPQSSKTGASPSDYLLSLRLFKEHSSEMQSVYSIVVRCGWYN